MYFTDVPKKTANYTYFQAANAQRQKTREYFPFVEQEGLE